MNAEPLIQLDLGCGPNKQKGFIGVDAIPFEGVDVIVNFENWDTPWPWADNSVDEIHSSHTIEHLTSGVHGGRVRFFNEIHRILKPGASARLIMPHWSNARAYGDPDHKWPPMSDFAFWYINRAWREANAPHTDAVKRGDGAGYTCNFDWSLAGTFDPNDPWVSMRNAETKSIHMGRNINCTVDLIANLTKVKE